MSSFLVIGGGFVGAAAALRLQRAGFNVTLIDPGDMRRAASFGNAGHLGAEQVSPWSTWENLRGAPARLFGAGGALDFRLRDVALWGPWSLGFMAACAPQRVEAGRRALSTILSQAVPAWLRLAADAGAPDLVRPHGHNNVWMSPLQAERGQRAWAKAHLGECSARPMSSEELARYEGVLTRAPAAGLHVNGTGQLRDPQAARDAILSSLRSGGGEIVADAVVGLRLGARITATLSSGATRDGDLLLVAAGAWSRDLMRMLDVNAPVIGERGYSVQSAEHIWPEDLPTTVFEERSVVLSRFTSGLRATSFLEFGAPDAPPDPRKWATLERHLRELGVRFASTPDRWVGPRPTLPDYLPAIGRLQRDPRAFYAFGHQHLGVTMSAITSELIEALATGRAATIDLTPFRVERFA
ncbi:MAG: NAD(P)/FAD-dependent oxidoreductase [Hyphomonadaceae bacterium]